MKMGIERCLRAAFGDQLVEVLQARMDGCSFVLQLRVAASWCPGPQLQLGVDMRLHSVRLAAPFSFTSPAILIAQADLLNTLPVPFLHSRWAPRRTTAPLLNLWTCI